MPVDARIPLLSQNQFDGAAMLERGLTLRDAARQRQMQEMKFTQEQQALQRDAKVRQAMAGAYDPATGQIDAAKVRGAYAGAGDIEGAMKFDKGQAEADAARFKQAADRIGLIGQIAGAAVDQPSYERALKIAQANGLDVSALPPQYDPNIVGQFQRQALDGKAQLEQMWKQKGYELDFMKFGYQQQSDAAQRAVTMRGQNMTDARAREKNMVDAFGVSKGDRKTEADLRKEFNSNPDVKGFREVATSYNQIKATARKANPTAADDIATVFSYMKMLDPGSVVREGEFATAQNAAGIPDKVRNAYNRAVSGNRLNPQQRQEFLNTAGNIVVQRGKRYNEVAGEFRGYATDYGVNPDRIGRPVPDITGQQRRPASGGASSGGGKVIEYDANGRRVTR